MPTEKEVPKQENAMLSLILNIVLPSILLMKGRDLWPEGVPVWTNLVVALSFPLGYGVYDFVTRRKFNLFSILGFVSVLLTGGFALSPLSPIWLAVKEAAIPAVLAIAMYVSLAMGKPLIRLILFNESIIKVELVEQRLDENGNRSVFDKLLVFCTHLLALSFLLSSVLNYFVARYFVISPAGSIEREQELGQMMIWSYPIIVVPMMGISGYALFKMIKGIKELTGLTMEEVLRTQVSQ